MKLATYETSRGDHRLGGVIEGQRIVDLAGAGREANGADTAYLTDMLSLIDGGPEALDLVRSLVQSPPPGTVHSLSDVRLLAPLPEPRQIRDCLVFEEHLKNSFARAGEMTGRKLEIPPIWYEQPIYHKANRFSVVGPEADVCSGTVGRGCGWSWDAFCSRATWWSWRLSASECCATVLS